MFGHTRRLAGVAALVAAAMTLSACNDARLGASISPTSTSAARSMRANSDAAAPTPTAVPTTAKPAPATPPRRTAATPTRRTGPAGELPRGGMRILGARRVVAYYGGPSGPSLGALGNGTPEQMAKVIERRAAQYAGAGRPVLPAMELIATVAQGAPGRDGTYSKPVGDAAIQRYLDAAHRHRMLLILDFQPGRGTFLPQVRRVARFLADPSVSVALDPEWKMGPGQRPGSTIGSSTSTDINAVAWYLSSVIARDHLPDKLLLVHQFTRRMLPDRQHIAPRPGVEVVFHADGFGTPTAKLATWRRLAFPGRPFGAGFKLFLRQDSTLLRPAQVLALHPAPDVITYQ